MNSEERQAAIDALKAILQSRKDYGDLPISKGPIITDGEIKIDPNLIYPAPKFPGKKDDRNVIIDDPNNLLSKLKQNKPNNNENKDKEGEPGEGEPDENKSDNSDSNGDQSQKQNDKAGKSDKEGEPGENTNKNGNSNDSNDDYADA